ncbi:MAG: hypothetical protein KBD60_10255 [Sterolibacterium sp.]|jgi:hypothetical protein|nr:hypothetical protein [Sterolibacterium sp.]
MTTNTTRTIRIVNADEVTPSAGCGSASAELPGKSLAAGIDTDIFEADIQELGGERFWEAYWKTQLTYGGVSEGQPLAIIFAGLPSEVFDKLGADVERLRVDHLKMHDDEKDDVFGMIIFLLGVERGDAAYDPIEHEGYEGAMARFVQALSQEMHRRAVG